MTLLDEFRAEQREKSCLAAIALALILPAAAIFGSMLNGYAISVLWRWFVVPAFGVAPISVPMAIGLLVTASMFRARSTRREPEKERKPVVELLVNMFAEIVAGPLVGLGIGAIVVRLL